MDRTGGQELVDQALGAVLGARGEEGFLGGRIREGWERGWICGEEMPQVEGEGMCGLAWRIDVHFV